MGDRQIEIDKMQGTQAGNFFCLLSDGTHQLAFCLRIFPSSHVLAACCWWLLERVALPETIKGRKHLLVKGLYNCSTSCLELRGATSIPHILLLSYALTPFSGPQHNPKCVHWLSAAIDRRNEQVHHSIAGGALLSTPTRSRDKQPQSPRPHCCWGHKAGHVQGMDNLDHPCI